MSKKYIFTILGGDRRQTVIAERLLSLGQSVRIFGTGDVSAKIVGAEICFSLNKAISNSDVIILPLPASRDGITLNTCSVDIKEKIKLYDVVDLCANKKDILILGGMLPLDFYEYAAHRGIKVLDFYSSESLQSKNALPSAEGAIMVAMQNTDRVFEGMKILVCGYGRIGKIIARKAQRLGADVSVLARRDEVLCEIVMAGYNAIHIADFNLLSSVVEGSDVIFNTIPNIVINKRIIDGIVNMPLYIEIASSPGGIDLSAARDRGLRVICAPSLPGKYSPVSAGEYIFETILDLITERGYGL